MTEPSDHEIGHPEGLIPALAASATHAAYLRAVQAGRTLIMARMDGSFELIRTAQRRGFAPYP